MCRGLHGRLRHVCGYLGWADDEGVGQLIQLGDFHSLGRLDHELVLVGVISEPVQLTRAQLVQLQLVVRISSSSIVLVLVLVLEVWACSNRFVKN